MRERRSLLIKSLTEPLLCGYVNVNTNIMHIDVNNKMLVRNATCVMLENDCAAIILH